MFLFYFFSLIDVFTLFHFKFLTDYFLNIQMSISTIDYGEKFLWFQYLANQF